jgi:hypothetical protein
VKEKFGTVIEGYNLLGEKIDRLAMQNEEEHQQLQTEIIGIRKDLVIGVFSRNSPITLLTY